ncbi:hypothetical protein NDU88_002638 [Pleurodeles waltl]|uniref:Uncharacterized protein n=1 Tax=Pleurodeles waltl TaxID=8319 RepID=A0AAV7MY05_PLEWA|nr:hypothetical protein NDU88_002638 [Pleurodeles waltl]
MPRSSKPGAALRWAPRGPDPQSTGTPGPGPERGAGEPAADQSTRARLPHGQGPLPPEVRDPQVVPAQGPMPRRAALGTATRTGAAPSHLSRPAPRPIMQGAVDSASVASRSRAPGCRVNSFRGQWPSEPQHQRKCREGRQGLPAVVFVRHPFSSG